MNKSIQTKGVAAILLVTTLGFVLLSLTTTLVTLGASVRSSVLMREDKITATLLARSCIEETLALLATNPLYRGEATATNQSGVCYVYPIVISADEEMVINVRATVGKSSATLVARVETGDRYLEAGALPTERQGTPDTLFTVTSIKEVPSGEL